MKHEVTKTVAEEITLVGTDSRWKFVARPAGAEYRAEFRMTIDHDVPNSEKIEFALSLYAGSPEKAGDGMRKVLIAIREQINLTLRDPWPL